MILDGLIFFNMKSLIIFFYYIIKRYPLPSDSRYRKDALELKSGNYKAS